MAKLKKHSIKKIYCPTCKGNGFLKVGTEEGDVHQPQAIQSDNTIDPATGDVVKLN